MRAFTGARCSGTLSLFVMCKAWHKFNERPRALASLNSPQASESRIPLKPVLGGVKIIALFISSHEKTQ